MKGAGARFKKMPAASSGSAASYSILSAAAEMHSTSCQANGSPQRVHTSIDVIWMRKGGLAGRADVFLNYPNGLVFNVTS